MTASVKQDIKKICKSFNNDASRLLDVAREIQARFGCVSPEAMDLLPR